MRVGGLARILAHAVNFSMLHLCHQYLGVGQARACGCPSSTWLITVAMPARVTPRSAGSADTSRSTACQEVCIAVTDLKHQPLIDTSQLMMWVS